MTLISHSPDETMALASQFAEEHLRQGRIVALFGELGAGKTQFVKGIARAVGIDERELTSPTYALANEYACTFPNGNIASLYHLDCYRFEKPEELLELGIEDYLHPDAGATIIEWAERIERYLPADAVRIWLEVTSPTERKITIVLHEGLHK